ncbi:MAG: response regulator [Ignavibacteriaceae bacterium]|nr:response regulator [Ignavibacteriaceae bacterium]
MDSGTILIIDDNIEFLAEAMAFLINELKLKVLCSFTIEEAEVKIKKNKPGIIILDLGINAVDKLSALKDLRPEAPVILVTSDCDNDDYPELSKEMGADAYCLKYKFKSAFPKLLKYLETGLNFATYRKEMYLMK